MKLPDRRRFLHLAAGAAALPIVSRIARAQTYPARPVRFIVPFPPGGSADPIARVLGNRLSEIWGQQVVIENKGGAGGNLGAQTAAAAPPDGYNIFLGGAFMAKNPFLLSGIGLRSGHGFGASGQSLRIQQHYGRSQFIAGEVRPGIHRSRQRQSRQGYLRFVGYWCRSAHEHRAVSEAHRHRDDARAVPRRRTGAQRRYSGPHRCVFRDDAKHATTGSQWTGARARSDLGQALRIAPELPTIAESGVPGYGYSSWYGV